MQSIQLFLRDSARNWLKGLSPESITSWDGLERKFVSNFQDTCKRPVSFQELKACRQKQGESIRSYIQRWTNLRNSSTGVDDSRAIDAFGDGLQRDDFREILGRKKPTTVAHLMNIANKWADGEDSISSK